MDKKIVILFEVHPVITYERRYDYQTLINGGYAIDVCDMSGLTSRFYSAGKSNIKDTAYVNNYSFYSRVEFNRYINSLNDTVFIWSTFQMTAEYYWIFRIISKRHYGFICNVDYVFPRSASSRIDRNCWMKWSWSRIKNAILYRIPRKYIPIRKADAVITYGAGDEQRKLNNVLYDKHTVVELTNTIDYNECTRALAQISKNMITDLPEKYIVFIDEYMPYHPDGLKMGMHIDGAKYYQEVENFLQRVSNQMDMPVIIAAHPKADYKEHSECYQGMRVIQFRTNELIRGARFVVTHLSIAIGMILVCRKPYLLITTEDVKNVIFDDRMAEDQERDLNCKTINISENLTEKDLRIEISKANNLSKEYFDEQILKYKLPQGHPNEQLSFGEIVIKAMKKVEESESKKI